jgi:hypothetical protein
VSATVNIAGSPLQNIPELLKGGRCFVLHKDKIPRRADGRKAAANRPGDWATFDTATAAFESMGDKFGGVGRIVTGGPFAAIDFDGALDETGELSREVADIIGALPGAFVEVSPSGRGLHAWMKGHFPAGHKNRFTLPDGARVEFYDSADVRFLTLTGNTYGRRGELSDEDVSDELAVIYRRVAEAGREALSIIKAKDAMDEGDIVPVIADNELIRRIRSSKIKNEFADLFDKGSWQAAGFKSLSEARMSLLGRLAFWTGRNREQMKRIFERSALFRENAEKWRRVGAAEITKAIASCSEVYRGASSSPLDTVISARRWREISKTLDADAKIVLLEIFLGIVREKTSCGIVILPRIADMLCLETGLTYRRTRAALKTLRDGGYIYLNRGGELFVRELWAHHLRVRNMSHLHHIVGYLRNEVFPQSSRIFLHDLSIFLESFLHDLSIKPCQKSTFSFQEVVSTILELTRDYEIRAA